jgi:hypothetical protein
MRRNLQFILVIAIFFAFPALAQVPGQADQDDPTCLDGARRLTQGEELERLKEALQNAISEYQSRYPEDPLARGWLGNYFICDGAKCDVVATRLESILSDELRKIVHRDRFCFRYYDVHMVVVSGSAWGFGYLQHVYFRVKDLESGGYILFADPWRSEQYFTWRPIEEDPNIHSVGKLIAYPFHIGMFCCEFE